MSSSSFLTDSHLKFNKIMFTGEPHPLIIINKNMLLIKSTLFLLILLTVPDVGRSRFIRTNSSGLVADGVEVIRLLPVPETDRPVASSVTCEAMYGFMPCATSIWGQLFLFVVYQYLLYLGDYYISAGTELLFKILGSGVFGASGFHLLGSLPQAALVLATGVYGSNEVARDQVVSGMSILAGSTVFLLTLVWGTCLVVGKFRISEPSSSSSNMLGRKLSRLTGYGVSTDIETSYTARIMLMSMIPFVIAQLPHLFGSATGGHIVTLVSLIITLLSLFVYCFYQVFQPWIQDRRLEYVMTKYVENNLLQKLLTIDGMPNTRVIIDLFHKIDRNKDKFVTPAELKGLIVGIQFEEVGLDADDFVEKLMREIDFSGDVHIDENEFVRGISQWLSKTKMTDDRKARRRPNIRSPFSKKNEEEEQDLLVDHKEKDIMPRKLNQYSLWTFIKAAAFLLLGTFIVTILAAPIIDTVQRFSTAANIPSFFIFFIVVPIAVNYREAVSTITSIRKRTQVSASLTFSEIYSAVFMNNILGLVMFLGIVYIRGFAWDFSAEVLIVLIVCIVMGFYTSFNTKFPLWTSLVAYLLYPLSVLLLYVLTYFLGWA